MNSPYLTAEDISEVFRSVDLEEHYNFLHDDLVKLANAFIRAAQPAIAKQEREICIEVARAYNTLVADKIAEVRSQP